MQVPVALVLVLYKSLVLYRYFKSKSTPQIFDLTMNIEADPPDQGDRLQEKDVDALLAKELNELSFQEREFVFEDIHGVSPLVEENEGMVEKALGEMENEIRKIPSKPDYDEALLRCKEYVQDRKFRLMFLRSRRFDPQAAAQVLIRYVHEKRKLYGDECLCRRVSYSDLDEDDRKCLATGIRQWIPGRDRSGRPIMCDFALMSQKGSSKWTQHMLKAFTYIMMVFLEEDEESQKTGICGMVHISDSVKMEGVDIELMRQTAQASEWLPLRMAAIHLCVNNKFISVFKTFMLAIMPREARARTRIHTGSPTELQYFLMSFGIPVDVFPLTQDGELKTGAHSKWIARQKSKEEYLLKRFGGLGYPYFNSFPGIETPSNRDVLLGRGKSLQYHMGNIQMRQLCTNHLDVYRNESKQGKEEWHLRIVQTMQQDGARFLKREGQGWWFVSSLEEAQKRAEMVFRVARASTNPADSVAAVKEEPLFRRGETHVNKRSRIEGTEDSRPFFDTCCGVEKLKTTF